LATFWYVGRVRVRVKDRIRLSVRVRFRVTLYNIECSSKLSTRTVQMMQTAKTMTNCYVLSMIMQGSRLEPLEREDEDNIRYDRTIRQDKRRHETRQDKINPPQSPDRPDNKGAGD
jgi:hypothetical protein